MDGNHGKRFCFAPNKAFKSECVQPTTNDFSEVIKFIKKVSRTSYLYRCSAAGLERVDVLRGEMLTEMATQGFCQKRSNIFFLFLIRLNWKTFLEKYKNLCLVASSVERRQAATNTHGRWGVAEVSGQEL